MNISRTTFALAAVLSPVLAVPAPSHAADTVAQWALDRTGACLTGLSGASDDWEVGSRCVGDRLGSLLVDEAARFMTEQGRGVFGEHFRLEHSMSWSPLGQGLGGELDAIIPLAFTGAEPVGAEGEALTGSAFFLQQGVTRWTDEHGFLRHDLRLGTTFRFALPRFAGADVVGATALVQQNAERATGASCSARTTPGAGAMPRSRTTSQRRSGGRGVRATRSARSGGPSSACGST